MKIRTQGISVSIDEDQMDWFRDAQLCLDPAGYVKVMTSPRRSVPLHWLIIGKAPKNMVIDHINRNKLDNRKENLRFITQAENFRNSDYWDKIETKKLDKEIEAGVDKIIAILDRPNTGLPKGRFERV